MSNEMKTQDFYGLVLVGGLALMPVIALCAPRFLSFWPGILGMAAFISYRPVFGKWPDVPVGPLLWCIAIILLAGGSSYWALDSEFALERTVKIALVLLPAVPLLAVAGEVPADTYKPHLKMVTYAIVSVCLLIGLELNTGFALYKALHWNFTNETVPGAVYNRAAISVFAIMFAGIAAARATKDWQTVLALFAVGWLLTFFTESQSAQLGFFLAFFCFFMFPYSRPWAWGVFPVLLAMGLAAAPFIAIWMYSLVEVLGNMPFIGRGGAYAGERLEVWDAVARYALQNPLYGYGIEATRAVGAFDMNPVFRESYTALHPHNFALQLWIEFGLIGVSLGICFFAHLFAYLKSCPFSQARIGLTAFMVLFCAASFGYGLWQSWFLGLIVFTIAFCRLAMRLYEDEKQGA